MEYSKGDRVLFAVGDTPHRGVITNREGDFFVVTEGGVIGAETHNGRVRAVIGGTAHRVHKTMIIRKTR